VYPMCHGGEIGTFYTSSSRTSETGMLPNLFHDTSISWTPASKTPL
jgi:hypothetical protein